MLTPLCHTLAPSTTCNHATRVTMIAFPLLRHTIRPQMPHLPPPGLLPYHPTTPWPTKALALALPTPQPPMEPPATIQTRRTVARRPCSTRPGRGEGEEGNESTAGTPAGNGGPPLAPHLSGPAPPPDTSYVSPPWLLPRTTAGP